MRQKLNIITLGVANIERSLNFYEKGLGWKKSSASQGDITFFNLGGMVLAIYPREELAKDITIAPQGSGFGGITLAINA
ncbi:MAG: VOC family protein, partial [Bacteroidia bacterium]|nr:VOC family protein [Bacteroidia bacterium]